MVNALYNSFAQFDDHSIGRQIPLMVYIRKFKDSLCIFAFFFKSSLLKLIAQKNTVNARCLNRHYSEYFEYTHYLNTHIVNL